MTTITAYPTAAGVAKSSDCIGGQYVQTWK